MNRTHGDRNTELVSGPANLHDAIDRWGPDLGRWPDLMLMRQAREALLADRDFRAYRDKTVAEAERLCLAAQMLERRIAENGSVERITRKLLEATGAKVVHWRRRIAALAAVMVVSAALGSVFAEFVPEVGSEGRIEVVQLDTLVFGPSEVDF
jgi:exoribonuclease R